MPYKDPEKKRANARRWYWRNREKICKKARKRVLKWQRENREKYRAKGRRYYERHREECQQKSLDYYYTERGQQVRRRYLKRLKKQAKAKG